MSNVLRVTTPEGSSGKILGSGGDYLFRYHEDAKPKRLMLRLRVR